MPHPRTSPRRLVLLAGTAAVAVAAAALPLAVAPGAAAQEPAPVVLRDVREFACPPGQVRPPGAGARFDDTKSSTFVLEIDCLAGFEVTLGTGDGRSFSPAGMVTRAQMAQFLARVAERASVPLDPRDAGFTDIAFLPASARDAINAMANAGVARGRTESAFDPLGEVRRDQMASFLVRLQEQVGEPFPPGEDRFGDDDGSTHEDSINRVAAAGIVQGVDADTYGFARSITRQQMAGFLTRYLDIAVETGEVPARYPRDNRVLPVTPAESAALAVGEERTFTAGNLRVGVEYRVTLVQESTVSTAADGTLLFADADGDRLAEVGSYDARITTVNGREVASAMPSTTTSVPDSRREVRVTVRGNSPSDDVVPVFYPNTGASPRLELAADRRPVEQYGVGGRTRFSPPDAQDGQTGSGTVTAHDRTRSTVTLDLDGNGSPDLVYAYGTDNSYAVEGQAQPREVFVARLTRGDTLRVEPYSTTPGGSGFDITDDTPTAPAVSAEAGRTASTSGRVTVTVVPDRPAPLEVYDRFVVERAPVTAVGCTSIGRVGSFQQVADLPPEQDADAQRAGFQYVDEPGQGCFRYRGAGVVDGQRSPHGESGNVASAPPAEPDTTRPVSTSATADDAGSSGTADAGDQLTAQFDEGLAPAAADAFVRVRNGAGALVLLRNGEEALFRVSGARLMIALRPGTDAGPYPLDVVEAGRITDGAGNPWSVDTSPDKRFDP